MCASVIWVRVWQDRNGSISAVNLGKPGPFFSLCFRMYDVRIPKVEVKHRRNYGSSGSICEMQACLEGGDSLYVLCSENIRVQSTKGDIPCVVLLF